MYLLRHCLFTELPEARLGSNECYEDIRTVWGGGWGGCTTLGTMGIAGYVSVCVQLYCVGFHCL
jgi:hypothetical protein